jgi:hypothetical protein
VRLGDSTEARIHADRIGSRTDEADDPARARQLAADQGYTVGEEFAELGLGLGARRQGELDRAETHLRNWLDRDRRMGADRIESFVRTAMGDAAFAAAFADGSAAAPETVNTAG